MSLEADQGAAVPAYVGEGAQLAILAAHDDGRLARDVHDLEVAGLRQLGDMPGEDPVPVDDALELQFEDTRVRVEGLVQRVAGPMIPDQFVECRHVFFFAGGLPWG